MRSFLISCLFILVLPCLSFANKGEGYIITLDGKKLSGEIEEIYYSDWLSKVIFTNDLGRTYHFNAALLQGFVYSDKGEEIEYVSKYKGGKWIFLKVVHRGEKLNLYQSSERKHYLIRQHYGYEEKDLLAREFWLEFNNRRPFQVFPLTYKKKLRKKFSKHPSLVAKIGEPGWRFQDLLKLVKEYNRLATSEEIRL